MKKQLVLFLFSGILFSQIEYHSNIRAGLLAPKNPGLAGITLEWVLGDHVSTFISGGFPAAGIVGAGFGVYQNYNNSGFAFTSSLAFIGYEFSLFYVQRSKSNQKLKFHYGLGLGGFFMQLETVYPIIGIEYEF